jgi:hypothetical protein
MHPLCHFETFKRHVTKIIAVLLVSTTVSGAAGRVENVSIVALIASPHRYNNVVVRTTGYLCIEFEGDALYLHREDFLYGMTMNAARLELTTAQRTQFKKLSSNYVIVQGTFWADKSNKSTTMYGGSIGKITRLELWPAASVPPAKDNITEGCGPAFSIREKKP